MNTTEIAEKETTLAVTFMLDGTEDGFVIPFLAESDEEQGKLSKLSDDERQQLTQIEEEIREGISDFNNIGYLLHQIKKKKLYRETHTTFAAYCKEKLDISRVHGDRLVNAYKTQEALKREPVGSIAMPTTESALRAMGGETDEHKVAIAKELRAQGISNPTAKDVQNVKSKLNPGQKAKPKTAKKPKTESLKTALEDINEAVRKVKEKKPEHDIIATLTKAAEHIEALLKRKEVV